MAQQNLPNGILPQMDNRKQHPMVLNQGTMKQQFNGVSSSHSSQSSRDHSPATRTGQIPSSQLPPHIPSSQLPPQIPTSQLPPQIPTSQLPLQVPTSQLPPQIQTSQLPQRQFSIFTSQNQASPAQSNEVSSVTQQIGQLHVNQATPKFETSTPNDPTRQGNLTATDSFAPNSAFSPITSYVSRSQDSPVASKGPSGRIQSSGIIGNNTEQGTPATITVTDQNKGHNVNINSSQSSSVFSQSNQQTVLSRPNQTAPFQQVPLSQPNSTPSLSQNVNQNQNLPYASQNATANYFTQPLGRNQNQNFAGQSLQYPNVQNQSPQVSNAQMPKQNVLLNGPPRLATSASQPKLLPPNYSQQNILSQTATTQITTSGTQNLYQPGGVSQALPNKPQQSYQVPQSVSLTPPMPPPGVITSTANQQKPSLFANRYPNMSIQQQQSVNAVPQQGVYNQQQQPANAGLHPGVYGQQQQTFNQEGLNQPNQTPYNQQQAPSYTQAYNQQSDSPYSQKPAYNQQQMFPQQQQQTYQNTPFSQPSYPGYKPTVASMGFNKLWGNETHDLLQNPNILPPTKIQPPKISLGQEGLDDANCSPDIFRCTMTKIPESNSLLQKSRLPLGILIHPFKDLSHLPVIQCNVIVRCRACRTYINPFVYFVDNKRWKCNLCYRINELPEEFQYDPVSKTYGDPSRRPEVRASTIEYIAPAEYMLRPPQPAIYLFLLDISRSAIDCGYLHTVCSVLLEELKNLPGDARTQIGFLAYDSALHFFSLAEGLSQPHEMTVLDIDDVFLPCPDNLLVNLKDRMELIVDLLNQLPTRYLNSFDNNSALGAALQVAHRLMAATGGRVTVFQSSLPNVGPGALTPREVPSQRSSVEVAQLNPANDFYKRLSLECSAQQIAVDMFTVNSQFVDLSTISGISRFSGGCMYHFPLFKSERVMQNEQLERCFRRYLVRKIGFEAVMRIRCTRGLSIHTFHGNFFVRSTDLLSLPNINPDAGYGMQVAIEESLTELQTVCFQAALLYTSSKGERRIRVHTLCLPVVSTLHDVIHSADQQCIIGLLAKMAVDRSMQSSLSDAREAFINVAIDILSSYKMSLNLGSPQSGLLAPECLKLLPLYISALLKNLAFRIGTPTRLDDRIQAMMDMKTRPLCYLMQEIYPDLYPIHNLEEQQVVLNSEEEPVPMPPRIQLTARCLDNKGAFLMDTGEHMYIYVCSGVSETFLNQVLGVPNFSSIHEEVYELPQLENPLSKRLHHFINYLNEEKPFASTLQVIRDNSSFRLVFLERLIEDRLENALSYHEFLQHLKSQVK